MEVFLSESFVDRKKLLLKGNKKIPLYNLSFTFNEKIHEYLNNVFVSYYKKKRLEKIITITQTVDVRFIQNSRSDS